MKIVRFYTLTKEVFKNFVRLENKLDADLQNLDTKLDKIYINTVEITKQFTDTAQKLTALRSRQMDHTDQLENHEERITNLETIE